jgi:transposase
VPEVVMSLGRWGGDVKYRKKLSRGQFFRFMSEQPPALVVMEACGSAYY